MSIHEAGEYLMELLGDRVKVRQAHPVTLPNHSEPEPDLAIVQQLGREYQSHHPYPENIFWIIEMPILAWTRICKLRATFTPKRAF